MITSYAINGESDQAFMALANECRARKLEEEEAAKRDENLKEWMTEVVSSIRRLGGRGDWVEDHYEWFERLYDGDTSSEQAAALAMSSNLDEAR